MKANLSGMCTNQEVKLGGRKIADKDYLFARGKSLNKPKIFVNHLKKYLFFDDITEQMIEKEMEWAEQFSY